MAIGIGSVVRPNQCPECGWVSTSATYPSDNGLHRIRGICCLRRQLAAANERAGRLEQALTLLISDLDKCPTRQRGGGASGQTVENNILATFITGLPAMCVERAREALEVPDAVQP